MVTTFPKRQVTSPWCFLQLIAKCLVLQGASYGDYYHHHHHHLRLRSEYCRNMEKNGQALLCSSHRVLMAWVWFCYYTALTITLMGCSLFQLLKLILLQILCQTETRMGNWGRAKLWLLSEKAHGRQSSGWNPSLPSPREELLFSFGVLSRIPRLSCQGSVCHFSLLLLFLSPGHQPVSLLPSPCGLCFLPSLHCVLEWCLVP